MRAVRTIDRARQLRADQTDVERRLWSKLRDRQLPSTKFRRQVPMGRYIVDFACRELSLIIELDGGQHGAVSSYDADRTRWLKQHGWRVLRFWNIEMIENMEGVLQTIMAAVESASGNPRPDPLPQAGEGVDGNPLPQAGEGDITRRI